jgi:hypothetical protein
MHSNECVWIFQSVCQNPGDSAAHPHLHELIGEWRTRFCFPNRFIWDYRPGAAIIFSDGFNLSVNLHLRCVSATMTRRKLFENRHAQCCCCRVLFAFVLLVISLIRFHPQWSIYLLRRGRYNKLEGLYLGQNIYIGLHGSVHDSLEWPHTEVKLEIGYCHNNSAGQISAPWGFQSPYAQKVFSIRL